MQKKKLLIAMFVLALAGLGIAGYSFAHHEQFVSGSFCTIGATFNCDTVNRGAFSEILGIPVALFGVIGYFFLAITAFATMRLRDRNLPKLLVAEASLGLAFALYLSGLEAFVIHSWCLLCLSSQIIMLGIFAISVAVIKIGSIEKSELRNQNSEIS